MDYTSKIYNKMNKIASSPPGWSKTVEELAKEYRSKGKAAEDAKSIACATAWKKKNDGQETGWAD